MIPLLLQYIGQKGITKMINSLTRINCDECHGHGVIFWGNDEDYDVEPCECVL